MGCVWAWEWRRFALTKQGGHPLRAVLPKQSISVTDVLNSNQRWGSRCNGRVRVSVWEVKLRCSKQVQPFTSRHLILVCRQVSHSSEHVRASKQGTWY